LGTGGGILAAEMLVGKAGPAQYPDFFPSPADNVVAPPHVRLSGPTASMRQQMNLIRRNGLPV